MAWQAGKQLFGKRYTIERQLGEGGFGITYLAMKHDGKRVVIKTLKDELFLKQEFDDRFRDEATQLAVCKHPHIVEVDNTFRHQQRFCIAMEYVEGEDLGTLVERQGYLSETEALEYIWQIGEALTYIHHKKGLLHRDVKPQNIMRRRGSYQVVLIDFGLARGFIPDITQHLTAWQTPAFAPPEQFIEQGRPGAYTDVYALAATLYFLLTKTVPTAAPMRALNAPLKPPRQVNPSISDKVHEAILQGMALEKDKRPQSVHDWFAMLPKVNLVFPTSTHVELISVKGVDYRQLEKLLAAGKWKEADRETTKKMLEVMGRTEEGWLRIEDINNFPCQDLQTIDQLWVQYSNRRFGFSVQKRIYQSLGGTREYNGEIWRAFGDRVGWRKNGNWLNYSQLTFTTQAPPAHLPFWWRRRVSVGCAYRGFLFSRVETCKL